MVLVKIAAAEQSPRVANQQGVVVIREYDEGRDKVAVEELERRCEVGGSLRGRPSLVTDLMGDPICRVRHFPTHIMLVAEYGEEKDIVGAVRGCVKNATRGSSLYAKLAYILGLRVSPTHRRLGIGTKLVKRLEEWCKENGAEYAYMATDCTNEPSINLFTKRCDYTKFRTPTMLVQPVHAHSKSIPSDVAIIQVPPKLAESIYRQIFANSEFFPKDIDDILASNLNLGTFMAVPKKSLPKWDPRETFLPPSFAILSVWNTKEVFKLQVTGVSALTYACCVGSRVLDAWMPWLRLPSFPDVFRQFGVYFMYGLHMEGKQGVRLMRSLCTFAYNKARDDGGCGAVVAEVGQRDPVREAIPHWTKFSLAEDLWCIKKLADVKQGGGESETERHEPSNWLNSRSSSPVIFVDPRDF
ncbi:FkbH domain containing protein [Parasponia andersonii]|uniref:FkbH domain containing protein n=1 Tax=Parasponia andersonii TaxID=3476 RepID=A0A2P5C883_PARAD|nr:FkbH domain containing protein [Parasponia andersonii]